MGLDQEILQGQGMTSLRTRQRLIERLTEKGISDIRVLEAMRDAPRHLFLDEALSTRAYEDLALPIGYQQTISQPYIVAKMTEALIQHDKMSPKPLKNVLEIGTGCGYQSYILSLFSKEVVSLERIKPLQEKAKKLLKALKVTNEIFNVDAPEETQELSGPNEEDLINYTKKFSDKTRNSYEDSKSFQKVYNFLEKTS